MYIIIHNLFNINNNSLIIIWRWGIARRAGSRFDANFHFDRILGVRSTVGGWKSSPKMSERRTNSILAVAAKEDEGKAYEPYKNSRENNPKVLKKLNYKSASSIVEEGDEKL